jgi:acyl-coenzyme A thioesterase PaaI-like protein
MDIRDRILRGIALNRAPGFHFAGNFLGVSYDRVDPRDARISLDPGPHCEDANGRVSLGAVAMLADIALATSIRAAIGSDSTRLATVSMHLHFTGAPLAGRLEARGECEGFIAGAAARQGVARFAMDAGGVRGCFGTGAFMALAPPAGVTMHPVVMQRERITTPLDEDDLDDAERVIVGHGDAALARADARHAFIDRFWGYEPQRAASGAEATMATGAHVGNRVGHVQGGILVGFGATTAIAALPAAWRLASATACFVSPGEGKALHARSSVVHRGLDTGVVRTEVSGIHGRRVLELLTTHARGGAES